MHVYYNQQSTNVWLLPVWPNHFDLRELETLIGTSATIFVLNTILAVALLVPALPANLLVLVSALLSTVVGVISIAFPTVVNYHAPTRDTLKTWTCRWSDKSYRLHQFHAPEQFQGLCHKTRFAYYSTIPVFVIQILLLCLGFYALFARHPQRTHQHLEKGDGHPLRDVSRAPQVSFDTKSESPVEYRDSTRILSDKI